MLHVWLQSVSSAMLRAAVLTSNIDKLILTARPIFSPPHAT